MQSKELHYTDPVISGLSNDDSLSLDGSTSVTIKGANFGPNPNGNWAISAVYGNATEYNMYSAHNCILSVEHTQVKCDNGAIIVNKQRSGLNWKLRIGNISPPVTTSS